MEKEASILEVMKKAGKPLKAGEISEISGIDQKEVAGIIKALQKKNLIMSPKRCFWQPK